MNEIDKPTYLYEGESLEIQNWNEKKEITFDELVKAVRVTSEASQASALKAINRMLTMRNWLIGYYIVEFEQKGKERAQYGDKLLKRLEERVDSKGLTEQTFRFCRVFYSYYPQMGALFQTCNPTDNQIGATVSRELQLPDNQSVEKYATVSREFISSSVDVISRLSFSHIRELLTIDDPLVRYFYEQECMRCTWSVRELRRQIGTNLHIRVGLSKDPEKCLSPYKNGSDCAQLQIREPYTFEFLGLKPQDVVTESDLEDALIKHLQEFLLEFGKGMCFEARQQRIIIDDDYYYPDLIFYNRIGHFTLIVELKNEPFSHENFGQLNSYVSYWKENEMQPGDNPPVGLLLCTKKGKKMVEYAKAGMDNKLFVSTYQLQLPDESTLEKFLLRQLEENQ